MTRSEAIKSIMSGITDQMVITSLGLTSREVFRVKDRARNFYMMGSMGCCVAFGLGLAYPRPKNKVVVIAGDGEVMMGAGTIFLADTLKLHNFLLYILDNGCHESTGGQPTCPMPDWNREWIKVIKVDKQEEKPPRIDITPKKIKRRFIDAINSA